MLLAGETGRGGRVLAERTVALTTTDRLTRGARLLRSSSVRPEARGWGLGVAAPAAGAVAVPLPQQVGWDGGSGTTWRSNLQSGPTGIPLTSGSGHRRPRFPCSTTSGAESSSSESADQAANLRSSSGLTSEANSSTVRRASAKVMSPVGTCSEM